jgi:hypothetical protein
MQVAVCSRCAQVRVYECGFSTLVMPDLTIYFEIFNLSGFFLRFFSYQAILKFCSQHSRFFCHFLRGAGILKKQFITTSRKPGAPVGILQMYAKKIGCCCLYPRLYSKVWPMLSIFDSNKQKTPLEISVVFDRWGAVL